MNITPELQRKFNASFSRIMKATPAELQKKWDGVIEWSDNKSYPVIQNDIIQNLPNGSKDAYVRLLNKLSRGNI